MKKTYKYYWEDFPVGSIREFGGITLSKADIVRFAREFDPQPFHVDEDAASHSPLAA
jgi:acyl dehydratase